ncbi:MAG: cell envelope integrity protein TolA [Cardiobacteriaceae bacterium]|nr:cell envelope integrity protein TolA [Cardiobacteriaceae bacterium]
MYTHHKYQEYSSFTITAAIHAAVVLGIMFLLNKTPIPNSEATSIDWEQITQLQLTETDTLAEHQEAERQAAEEAARQEAERQAAEEARRQASEEAARQEAIKQQEIAKQKVIEEKRIAEQREKKRKEQAKQREKQKEIKREQAEKQRQERLEKEALRREQAAREAEANARAEAQARAQAEANRKAAAEANARAQAARAAAAKAQAARAAASAGNDKNYKQGLYAAIQRNKRYPNREQQQGITGTPVIAFTVLPDGTISNVRIARSSGNTALDQAALEAVRRVGHYKPTPNSTAMNTSVGLEFVISRR